MSRVVVTFVLVIGVLGFARGSAAQETEQQLCDRLPRNIQIYEMFQPTMESLLAQSPTLLRQCRVIAATPHVRVIIQVRSPLGGLVRARASISRHEAGFITARIQLPIAQDLPELLAHELEHVIEQIEGVDLAAVARRDSAQARRDPDGTFETRRATRAGQAAAGEVEMYQAQSAPADREAGRTAVKDVVPGARKPR